MRRSLFLSAALAGITLVIAAGCGTAIPPKLEVRDVSSGRTYTTYQPWGEVERGVGYQFVDLETGRHINLTNYELRTLEGKKTVPSNSPEAQAFAAARERGGVK